MPTQDNIQEQPLSPEQHIFEIFTRQDIFGEITSFLSAKEIFTLHQVCKTFDTFLKTRNLSLLSTKFLSEYAGNKLKFLTKEAEKFEKLLGEVHKRYESDELRPYWESRWSSLNTETDYVCGLEIDSRIQHCSAHLSLQAVLHAILFLIGIALIEKSPYYQLELLGYVLAAAAGIWFILNAAPIVLGRGTTRDIILKAFGNEFGLDFFGCVGLTIMMIFLGPGVWLPSSILRINPFSATERFFHRLFFSTTYLNKESRILMNDLIDQVLPYLAVLEKRPLGSDVLLLGEQSVEINKKIFPKKTSRVLQEYKVLLISGGKKEEEQSLNEKTSLIQKDEQPLKTINTFEEFLFFHQQHSKLRETLTKESTSFREYFGFFETKSHSKLQQTSEQSGLTPLYV